jgi:hypothetical protein
MNVTDRRVARSSLDAGRPEMPELGTSERVTGSQKALHQRSSASSRVR